MTFPDPLPLAAAWTAGTALASAGLGWLRVGGTGVRLLLVAVTATGVLAMGVTGAPVAAVAVAVAGCAVAAGGSRSPRWAAAGWALLAAAALPSALGHGPLTAAGESLLLGCITVGLCLGHWFLVDPHLPRGPMRALAVGALAGLGGTALGTWSAPPTSPPLGPVTLPVVLASGAVTGLVLVGAIAALAVPTYKGVQSATGLFYVATMSVTGFVVLATTMRAVP